MNIHQCYIWIGNGVHGAVERTCWWRGASGGPSPDSLQEKCRVIGLQTLLCRVLNILGSGNWTRTLDRALWCSG
jgi:hypothetical protein